MTDRKYLKQISKRMSWVLRHGAERLGLSIDPEGYIPVEELLAVLQETVPSISEKTIHAVIEGVETQKQRFSIADGYIRANYGHSLAQHIKHIPAEPPGVLYHGTSTIFKELILAEGLRPMKRQYVHLTTDPNLAAKIGSRHGKPCVLTVDARKAYENGIEFYQANRSFWLVTALPKEFLVNV
jgi:putative RNA 2'-phosphotransferase